MHSNEQWPSRWRSTRDLTSRMWAVYPASVEDAESDYQSVKDLQYLGGDAGC